MIDPLSFDEVAPFEHGRVLEIPTMHIVAHAPMLIRTTSVFRWRDNKRILIVPPGFYSDGATIPNLLYPLLSATAILMMLPGFAHDACYRSGFMLQDLRPDGVYRNHDYNPDRYEADKILSKIAGNMGVSWRDRKKIFYGVRIAAGDSYQQKSIHWTA